MKSEWKEVKLSDIADVIDSLHKTPQYVEKGIPMIRVTDIKEGYLSLNSALQVSNDVYDEFTKKYKPKIGDIVISRVGTYGVFSYVAEDKQFCLGQNTSIIIPKINSKFLFYWLISPYTKHYLNTIVTGSTQKTISLKNIKTIPLYLPNNEIQIRIADILSAIDDKIALNQQINNNLEQQIDLIYQSFFVEDMERVELGKAIETTSGGTPSRKNLAFYENADIPWVKSKELSGNFITETEEKINQLALNKSSAKLLPSHSVLVAMYGATVGEYGIITTEMACNQAICALLENCDYPFTYLFEFVKHFQEVLKSRAIGSAQQNISQLVIKQLMVHSNTDKIKKYHKIVLPLFQKMELLCKENARLTDIRDCLLPKLMSGEISFGGNES